MYHIIFYFFKSTNGLFVNKKSLSKEEETTLNVGDIIQLGHSERFIFRLGMKELGEKKEAQPNDPLR